MSSTQHSLECKDEEFQYDQLKLAINDDMSTEMHITLFEQNE